jgi:hypothetical protein
MLLDSRSDNNLIIRPLVIIFRFQIRNKPLGEIKGLNRNLGPIYSLVETKLQITDSVEQYKSIIYQLYIIDILGINLILRMPWFKENNPIID